MDALPNFNKSKRDPKEEINEKRLREWLMRLHGVHWQPVETYTSQGVPDLNYRTLNHEGWIELKTIRRPARASTLVNIELRSSQVAWISKRQQAGGTVWVLLAIGYHTLVLLTGHAALELQMNPQPYKGLLDYASWYCELRPWPRETLLAPLDKGYGDDG